MSARIDVHERARLGQRYLFSLRPILRFGEDKTDSIGLAGRFGFDAMSAVGLIGGEQAVHAVAAPGHSLEMKAGGAETIELVVYCRPVDARRIRPLEAGDTELFRRGHMQFRLPDAR